MPIFGNGKQLKGAVFPFFIYYMLLMENSAQAVQIVCSFYSVNMKICRFVLGSNKKRAFLLGIYSQQGMYNTICI